MAAVAVRRTRSRVHHKRQSCGGPRCVVVEVDRVHQRRRRRLYRGALKSERCIVHRRRRRRHRLREAACRFLGSARPAPERERAPATNPPENVHRRLPPPRSALTLAPR